MLSSLGVQAAIWVTRRGGGYFGETDDGVARKVAALLGAGMYPIMCVGEGEAEREAGRTEEVLTRQVPAGLASVRPEDARQGLHRLRAHMGHRYRPHGHAGDGAGGHSLRACAGAERLGSEAAERVRILYGGSVTPDNVDELMAERDIDGALVGGASLQVGRLHAS